MTTDWQLISFIKRSKYREQILKVLNNPKTPTQIKKEVKIDKAHVTRALQSLIEKGLVVCHTPEARKYKIFERNGKGNKIIKRKEFSNV